MWFENVSSNLRLGATLAEAISANPKADQYAQQGDMVSAVREVCKADSIPVASEYAERKKAERELNKLELMPNQLPQTFSKWIKEKVLNPDKKDVRKYGRIIMEKGIEVWYDSLEENLSSYWVFNIWGVYQATVDFHYDEYSEDLGSIFFSLFYNREAEIAKFL